MCTPTLLLVCSTLFLASGAYAQVSQDLGSFGGSDQLATALSGDGAVVVGYTLHPVNPLDDGRAFRWTAAIGLQDIGNLGGAGPAHSFANNVNASGDVIVGRSLVSSGSQHAFRWVSGAGMQDLGSLNGYSDALDVSADGQVVVGNATYGSGRLHVFRWTQATGIVDLGPYGPWDITTAHGVSGDGAVIVGWYFAGTGAANEHAFRWTATSGFSDLGTLGGLSARATAANWDGSVVVGHSTDAAGNRWAFRWTAAGGMQRLDDLGGPPARASDVDAAGMVVVGASGTGSAGLTRAFRWTAASGAVELPGFPGLETIASGVSADGGAAAGFAATPGALDYRALRWRWSTLGSVECSGEPNSTGGHAALSAYGSLDVVHGDLALRADGLPLGSWAFALSSRDAGLTFPLPGSQGRLCLGGAFGRHNGAGDVKRSSAIGSSLVWILDPAAFPSPSGPVAVQPGETWRFQVWYRDANPGATSNLTDAIALTYQ